MFQKLVFLFLIAICFLGSRVNAQEIISNNQAELITQFKFELLTGGVAIIRAKFDDISDSLNFILDTGSGGISLDSTTAAIYKIPLSPSNKTIRGIGGIRKVWFAENHSLFLPGLEVDSLQFHINNYELLTSAYGVQIDGIIGYSFFSRYLVFLNYDKKEISVFTPGEFRYPRGGFMLRPNISAIPVVKGELVDNVASSTRYFFDTGAGLNLLFSSDYAEDSSIFKPSKKTYPTVAEGMGGKAYLKMALLKSFKIGRYRFRNIPVHIFNDEYNITAYPYLGGLVGNNLLRRFNTILNYPKAEIYLVPNTAFNEPFDYSYTGLGIMQVSAGILISDVIGGSPAEKADLKVGDHLLGVDNNLSQNIITYRNLLQQTGQKVKLLIYRNQMIFEKYITVGRLK